MKLYSTAQHTNNRTEVSLSQAVIDGLPPQGGLYLPTHIPMLPSNFFDAIQHLSFNEIAFEVSKNLLQNALPADHLHTLIHQAYDFGAPTHSLNQNTEILELFHGPSAAFKDFGARFMAALLTYFLQQKDQKVTILVATSGDTGGAVALGFLDAPNIDVVILYPQGKVSPLQEKQLTTLGKNIQAIEIQGTFDDCQRMVKQAFLDNELTKKRPLSSANSINIARLIPQSFYYFEAYKQLKHHQKDLVFSVPSGNFGNLCAGILAKKMGLPIAQLIAATNANSIVPEYLHSGVFAPRASVPTISNAMDVGNPSNFERIQTLMGSHAAATQHIAGYHFTDAQTTAAIAQIYQQYDYIACPHTAVGYLGWEAYTQNHPKNAQNQLGVVLATAHPAKFVEVMPVHIAQAVQLPASLQNIMQKTKKSVVLPPTFDALKSFLM